MPNAPNRNDPKTINKNCDSLDNENDWMESMLLFNSIQHLRA